MEHSISLDISDSSLRHRSFSVTNEPQQQQQQQNSSSSGNNINQGSFNITTINQGSFGSRASMTSVSQGPVNTSFSGSGDNEIACKACGFEASFVPEGMLTCEKCNQVHYCSQHCKDWDWKSGGHEKECPVKKAAGASQLRDSLSASSGHGSWSVAQSLGEESTDETEVSIGMEKLFDKPSRLALMMRQARRAGPGGRPTVGVGATAPFPRNPSGRGSVRRLSSSSQYSSGSGADAAVARMDFRKEKSASPTTTRSPSAARGRRGSATHAPEGELGSFLNKNVSPEKKHWQKVSLSHSGSLGPAPFMSMGGYNDDDDTETDDRSSTGTSEQPSFASYNLEEEEDETSLSFFAVHSKYDQNLHSIIEENSKMMSKSTVVKEASWRRKDISGSPSKAYDSFQASFTSNTSRLVMEDSAIIGSSDHTKGSDSIRSQRSRQEEDEQTNGVGFGANNATSLLGDHSISMMDASSSSINVNFDEKDRPSLHELVIKEEGGKNYERDLRTREASSLNILSQKMEGCGNNNHYDIHEDSVLLELEYSDVSSRDSGARSRRGGGDASHGDSLDLGASAPMLPDNVDEEEEPSQSSFQMGDLNPYSSAPSSPPKLPPSPSRASSLKSFREAYNGDSSATFSPGQHSESSSGVTGCQSLKDFREIYEAEKDEGGYNSDDTNGTGKGSAQLKKQLSKLVESTKPALRDCADEADNDNSCLPPESVNSQQKMKSKLERLPTEALSISKQKGTGLYFSAKSDGDSSSSSNTYEKERKTAGSMNSLKEFRDSYNSDSSSKSVEQKSESRGSVTHSGSANNSNNALKDFRDIYEKGKDEPSVISFYSDGTNSTGKGSVQLRDQLAKLLSSSQSSQCNAVPSAVDEPADEEISMLTTSPRQEGTKVEKSLLNGSSQHDITQTGKSLVSERTESTAVSQSLLAAKERNESMKVSLNNALRVYEEMYGEEAAKEVFLKLTSEIELPAEEKTVRQTSGEETFDWKRSSVLKPENPSPHPPVDELSSTKVGELNPRFLKYRSSVPSPKTEENNMANAGHNARENSESHNSTDEDSPASNVSQTPEKPRYMRYRASLSQKDLVRGAEPSQELGTGDISNRSSINNGSVFESPFCMDESKSSSQASVSSAQRPQPGYMQYRAKLSTQNETPIVVSDSNDAGRLSVETKVDDISSKRRNMQDRTTSSTSKGNKDTAVTKLHSEKELSESMNESARSQSSGKSVSFAPETYQGDELIQEISDSATADKDNSPSSPEMPRYLQYRVALKTPGDNENVPSSQDSDGSGESITVSQKSDPADSFVESSSNHRFAQYREFLTEPKPVVDESEKSDENLQGWTSVTSGAASADAGKGGGQVVSTTIPHYSRYRNSLSDLKQVTTDESEESDSSSRMSKSVSSHIADADDTEKPSASTTESPYGLYRTSRTDAKNVTAIDQSEGSASSTRLSKSVSPRVVGAENKDEPNSFTATPHYARYRRSLEDKKEGSATSKSKVSGDISSGDSKLVSSNAADADNATEEVSFRVADADDTDEQQAGARESRPRYARYRTLLSSSSKSLTRSGNGAGQSEEPVVTISMPSYARYRSSLTTSEQVVEEIDESLNSDAESELTSSARSSPRNEQQSEGSMPKPMYLKYRASLSTLPNFSDSSSSESFNKTGSSNRRSKVDAGTKSTNDVNSENEICAAKPKGDPPAKAKAWVISSDTQISCDSDSSSSILELHYMQYPALATKTKSKYEDDSPSSTDWGNASLSRILDKDAAIGHETNTQRTDSTRNDEQIKPDGDDAHERTALTRFSTRSKEEWQETTTKMSGEKSTKNVAASRVDRVNASGERSKGTSRKVSVSSRRNTKAAENRTTVPFRTSSEIEMSMVQMDEFAKIPSENSKRKPSIASARSTSGTGKEKANNVIEKGNERPNSPIGHCSTRKASNTSTRSTSNSEEERSKVLAERGSERQKRASRGSSRKPSIASVRPTSNSDVEHSKLLVDRESEDAERPSHRKLAMAKSESPRRESIRRSNASPTQSYRTDIERAKFLADEGNDEPMSISDTSSGEENMVVASSDPLQVSMREERVGVTDPTDFIDAEAGIQNQDHLGGNETGTTAKQSSRKQLHCFLIFLLLVVLSLIGLGVAYAMKDGTPSANPAEDDPSKATPASTQSPTILPTTLSPMTVEARLQKLLLATGSEGIEQDIKSNDTPQYFSFQWLLSDPELFSKYSEERIIQRYALASFYHSTDGQNWKNNEGWLTDADECDWYTLLPSCDSQGVYQNLNLGFNGLSGTIPQQVALLSNLRELVLTGTTGSPRTIGGVLPEEIGQMKGLRVLGVQGNLLFGRIPAELGELIHLEILDLSMNRFTLSIPAALSSLTSLRTLNLAMNEITGEIPDGIDQLSKLEVLNLGDNNLSGRVNIQGLPLLNTLNLEKNRFTSLGGGNIGTLESLEVLTVYENRLLGEIVTEIGQLTKLQRLNLHSNLLHGPIPSEIGRLQALTDLNLSSNNLSSSIPEEIGRLENLVNLALQSNQLVAPLPNSLGQLTKAKVIRIDKNNISGEISLTICTLFNTFVPLFYLDCAADRFGGPELTCPNEFCCTYCCNDDTQNCQCKHEGTFFDALCSNDHE